MPAPITNGDKFSSKKRKRAEAGEKSAKAAKEAKRSKSKSSSSTDVSLKPSMEVAKVVTREEILALEEAIIDSPKNYNNIVKLQEYLQDSRNEPELAVTSAVSLCRTFCRLMVKGRLTRKKGDDEAEATIVAWLKDRYKDYVQDLCKQLGHEDAGIQSNVLILLMRLVKEEAAHLGSPGETCNFPHSLFGKIVKAIVYTEGLSEDVKKDFVQKYVNEYDDVRFSFFTSATSLVSEAASSPSTLPQFTATLLSILIELKNLPTPETEAFSSFYAISVPKKSKDKQPTILQLNAHRKAVQECWLATLRLPGLTKDQCKEILSVMTNKIVPSFIKPQLLMDFMVDCYDVGGSMSLLALNGLFHLISVKNLDYPNFYPKLYALLNRDLFHMRYRSRFFRLLDVFLGSTHLSAALVASFIKKMSRLSLSAPPAAIVTVVPMIYNLLKKHASCTFMVHRVGTPEDREQWRKQGLDDPFDEDEMDPAKTGAIDSCLWEIEMLQSHWHPNVATLAKIIGEQFTKERYNMEDFLDHSYATMFDAEANKNIKKLPVVEFEIPKKIFFRKEVEEGKDDVEEPSTLLQLWSFE
ncbi:Maturation and nuclear export of 40S ribosomal subunits interacting protein [Rhizina undulata]